VEYSIMVGQGAERRYFIRETSFMGGEGWFWKL